MDKPVPSIDPESGKKLWRIKPQTARVLLYAGLLVTMVVLWRFMRPPHASELLPVIAAQPAPILSNVVPIVAQQASVASIVEVIVGRNDTLDSIFRRAAFPTSPQFANCRVSAKAWIFCVRAMPSRSVTMRAAFRS
jgi:hypothetical protein